MFENYMTPVRKLHDFFTKTIGLPIPFAHDGLGDRRGSVHDGFGDNRCTDHDDVLNRLGKRTSL